MTNSATLSTAWAQAWMKNCAAAAHEHREELIELDRAIGDSDHGENVDRGFRAVVEKVDSDISPETSYVADVLKLTAKTLMSTVGGASGPLLGTAFLRAAKAAGPGEIDAPTTVALIEAALEGITVRGKAAEGEKTMVDAWAPAARAARDAADAAKSPAEVLRAAADAAAAGAEATIPMVATKGRASYLGERSAGHKDPGATSSALFIAAAADAAETLKEEA
ncbi:MULTISPECIES: dihydroxyacetone kinase subunit DhaL [unclassified Corynebacterium]|uniref:dihydroxyacetone kinase subunit DhaL n=1 Tax=unclassified Corynebacterium TaxID=2624378 RepID=UPI0008A47F0B|nr:MULTISPECIES: dihydroxyacetone kinase subunit DhaL [unclassified Corynebacterium]OFN77674.1 dihydroxyacetone kinase subunit L [Corynebacterium sp. HMSC074E01]OFP65496.1 dihydroxyacetone kinase subunit L [Corynebacterium sp. HMSC074C01]OHO61733.1 dihydroxyacetone kinase subunit L [Corynebacterium sp. HMSC036D02]